MDGYHPTGYRRGVKDERGSYGLKMREIPAQVLAGLAPQGLRWLLLPLVLRGLGAS